MVVGMLALAGPRDESSPSDEELMLRYAQGEACAFEVLYYRHRQGVYNFILRSVGDREQAEELLQDVFMRIIRNAAGYERQARFTTWLYTIARNICIDAHRRGKHRQTISLNCPVGGEKGEENMTLEGTFAFPHIGGSGERRAIDREIRLHIEQGLSRLSEEQREVFLLRESSNLAYKEIAQIVGCPENTVKSRMRYALENLRSYLESVGLSPAER